MKGVATFTLKSCFFLSTMIFTLYFTLLNQVDEIFQFSIFQYFQAEFKGHS